jgi:2,3,4,5-tetrahydropyridine-2,6-dicarboxylate N-succinyltransferase
MARARKADNELQTLIESAFERRATLTPDEIDGSTRPVVEP